MIESAAGTVAGAVALKDAIAAFAPFAELHAKIRQSSATILPLLLIYQRKSPQTLKIYRYSIHLLFLQDRLTLANARSPPHTPTLLHMVLKTMCIASAASLDRSQIAQIIKQPHFAMLLTPNASYSSGCASIFSTRLPQ